MRNIHVGETHGLVTSCTGPRLAGIEPAPHVRVLAWELNRRHFSAWVNALTTESLARALIFFFFFLMTISFHPLLISDHLTNAVSSDIQGHTNKMLLVIYFTWELDFLHGDRIYKPFLQRLSSPSL